VHLPESSEWFLANERPSPSECAHLLYGQSSPGIVVLNPIPNTVVLMGVFHQVSGFAHLLYRSTQPRHRHP